MTFDLKDLTYFGGIAFTIVAGVLALRFKVDRLKEIDEATDSKVREVELQGKNEDANQWKVIETIRQWISDHEMDVSNKRIEMEKEMSRLRESYVKTDGRMDQIFDLLETINKKIDRLELRAEQK